MNEGYEPLGAIGGRKFVFGMTIVILSFVLVVVKVLEVNAWVTLVEIVGGTYVIGNVGATIANKL